MIHDDLITIIKAEIKSWEERKHHILLAENGTLRVSLWHRFYRYNSPLLQYFGVDSYSDCEFPEDTELDTDDLTWYLDQLKSAMDEGRGMETLDAIRDMIGVLYEMAGWLEDVLPQRPESEPESEPDPEIALELIGMQNARQLFKQNTVFQIDGGQMKVILKVWNNGDLDCVNITAPIGTEPHKMQLSFLAGQDTNNVTIHPPLALQDLWNAGRRVTGFRVPEPGDVYAASFAGTQSDGSYGDTQSINNTAQLTSLSIGGRNRYIVG